MAASGSAASLSKAEYLKRYLSADQEPKKTKDKVKKRKIKVSQKRIRIVDDDVDWKQVAVQEEEKEEEEDEAPVVAEVVDERPDEVKHLEAFRSSSKWKVMGVDDDDDVTQKEGERLPTGIERTRHDSPEPLSLNRRRHDSPDSHSAKIMVHTSQGDSPDRSPPRRSRHDSPDVSPRRRIRHDSPDQSQRTRIRHDSPDLSPRRQSRHDSPDLSPQRRKRDKLSASPPPANQQSGKDRKSGFRDTSPASRKPNSSSSNQKYAPDSDRRPRIRHDSDLDQSPPRKRPQKSRASDSDQSPQRKRPQKGRASDSDQSPPRRRPQKGRASDSDQSPPRRRPKTGRDSDSDQSPPRRPTRGGRASDDDLSPPRRPGQSQGQRMLSGGTAGLVGIEVLRKEQEEIRRRDKDNMALEEASREAQTVFRDKSGRRRDLETEREEQKRKEGEKAAKDEKYAQWGKGLAQGQMQQQNIEDVLRESQKPLARHRDDEDLDRLLREQEREGDPMAAMLRRKKERNNKLLGVKEKPRYKGPAPPPNRFNIAPGYRWDGVDRSNGFEAKRYTRMSNQKAVAEEAYKWSVEDM